MNSNEQKVLDLINIKTVVSTREICEKLGLSESTARRLLVKLSDLKLIGRYHGGGQSLSRSIEKTAIEKRIDVKKEVKEKIAKTAAAFVKNDSVIIMMGGTTVFKMCRFLKKLNITVITNSILVFDELAKCENINLILLGGKYNDSEKEVSGAVTHAGLKFLRADYVFMGTMAFNTKSGFLTDDINSVELYRHCIESAEKSFVLADSSKAGKRGMAVTAEPGTIHCLITDDGLPEDIFTQFSAVGMDIIKVNEYI